VQEPPLRSIALLVSTSLHEPTIATEGELRPTHVEVNRTALAENLEAIRAHVGTAGVMPILKANAYGHGLVEVARLYAKKKAAYLGLAYLEEGLRLRQEGITTPILILGGILGRQIPLFIENNLTLTASSVDKLDAIEACARKLGRKAKVHLKIDTGMERIGVHWYSAEPLLERSLTCPNVEVEGIFSHFANAYEHDLTRTHLQLERFLEVCHFFAQRSVPTPLRHMANSAALLHVPESHLDMVRPGLLLYGVTPDPARPSPITVRPALCWKSRVVYFKVVLPGNPVSYGGHWAPTEATRVVTLPVGYGDGYPRRMSGHAEVILGDRRYPVVGSICMDQVMVDIQQDSAYNGDAVILLGGQGSHALTVHELAKWAGTVPYEILTGINTRVPRTYINEGEPL
jgi:alanine racemase